MAAKPGLEPNSRVEIPPGLAGAGVRALVREVYVDMRERLLAEPGGLLACVYGTPGVGKSIFASLLVLSLAERGPNSIFYRAFRSPTDITTLCIRGTQLFIVAEDEMGSALFQADHGDKPSWFVIDGTAAASYKPRKSLRVVVVSSTDLENNHWLHKMHKEATLKLLMPPFTLEELRQLSDAPTLLDRFAEFGGSAWLVCGSEPHEGWARRHVRALGTDLLRRVMEDVAEGSRTERQGKRILHQVPGPQLPDSDPMRLLYAKCVVAYASPLVSDAVVETYWEQSKSEVLAEVLRELHRADASSNPFVVSLLLEPLMHHRLRHGRPFARPEGGEAFRLPRLRLHVLSALCGAARLCPEGAYLQAATKTCAAVDAVAKCGGKLYLFQLTGQQAGLLCHRAAWVTCPDVLACARQTMPSA